MKWRLLVGTFVAITIFLFIQTADCFAASRDVTLQWDQSPDVSSLQSYRIYYYTVSGDVDSLDPADYAVSYTLASGSPISINPAGPKPITIDKTNTQITIHFVSDTKNYYFSITSIDIYGVESDLSPELSVASPSSAGAVASSDGGGGGGGCFIATAAFGSYLDPHVFVLRLFRDNVLMKHFLGQAFVRGYYRHSPPVADFIAKHESLRFATRVALTPLIYGVQYPWINLWLLIVPAGIVYRTLKNRKKLIPA